MNLLFTTYQGDVAGSTHSMYYLARALAEKGHTVFFACRPESLLFKMLEDTPVKKIPMQFQGKFDLKAARKIKQIVESENIEIINSQSGRDRYAVILSRIIYGNQCIHVNTRRQKPRSEGGVLVSRFIARDTDKVVAVSQSIKKDLVATGYPESHVEVIYNGTPREKYPEPVPEKSAALRLELGIDGSHPVIGSVSRPKRHEQLLKALKFLNRKVILLLVGIDETENFKKIIKEYTTGHEVHFLGTVPNENALAYMQLFDMMVLPSTLEGISQSVLEAMAMGVPVIATHASGNPELINEGQNGLLFEDGDIRGLAEKITNLLDDPEKRHRIAEAGRETAFQDFSIERTVKEYEDLFLNLIS